MRYTISGMLFLLAVSILGAEADDAVAKRLAAHWQTVRVQVKPEQPTLSFNFECDDRRIYWTVTAANGIVDFRSYDVVFFNGNRIVGSGMTILEKLKRGQTSQEDSVWVNPFTVTRIEVRLRVKQ